MLEHLIINPKKFILDNVIDMKYMFYECFSINNREKVYLFFQKRLKQLGISRRVFFGYEMTIELKKYNFKTVLVSNNEIIKNSRFEP